jgi:hypothetical protein
MKTNDWMSVPDERDDEVDYLPAISAGCRVPEVLGTVSKKQKTEHQIAQPESGQNPSERVCARCPTFFPATISRQRLDCE